MSSINTKGTAVLTGASGGIGAVYADRLAQRGYDLLLVARDGKRLGEVASRLTKRYGVRIETLAADSYREAFTSKARSPTQDG